MAANRFVPNRRAARQVLRSPEVQADIKARVDRIAEAAGEGFFSHTAVQRTRTRGSVVAAWNQARAAQERSNALTAAVDAGRGNH